jgi:hypothetical protein
MSLSKYWRVYLVVVLAALIGLAIYIFHLIRERQLLQSSLNASQASSANFIVAEGSIFFDCQADFDQLHKSFISLPTGAIVRRWINCYFLDKTEQKQAVTLALFIEDYQSKTVFTPLGLTAGISSGRPMADIDIDHHLASIFQLLGEVKGTRTVNITTGKDPDSLIKDTNPLQASLKTDLGNQMMAFGNSGEVSDLPTFSDLNAPLVIPYRISLTP